MLVLTRRIGEGILINGNIQLRVVGIKGERIRLGITAPKELPIRRAEVEPRPASPADSADVPLPRKLTTSRPGGAGCLATAATKSQQVAEME